MNLLPKNSIQIDIPYSTVPFYTFIENEFEYFYFDTSSFAPPEPMINAMAGLRVLKNHKQKLIMINHKLPMGLFPKIDKDFDFIFEEFKDFIKV